MLALRFATSSIDEQHIVNPAKKTTGSNDKRRENIFSKLLLNVERCCSVSARTRFRVEKWRPFL